MDVLTLRDNAKQQLEQIKTIESGYEYLNKVKAIEVWAKAEKKDAKLQKIITAQKLRTQRIIGKLIKEGQEKGEIASQNNHGKGIQSSVNNYDTRKTLLDIGITRNESSTFQRIADIPEEIFEQEVFIDDEEPVKGELTTGKLIKIAKDLEKETKRKEKAKAGSKIDKIDIDFRLGDFEEVFADLPDGSIDCIITDPPYPYEFIECWTKLSRFAKRKLKPNGFCIAYSGQMNLPEVYKRMTENLNYYWTFSLNHTGSNQLISGRNIFCGWKPILVFQNGFSKLKEPISDIITGSGREKYGHKWQQAEAELYEIIELFTNEGDKIFEPFAGSGTTLKAAKVMNRIPIGAEIDEMSYNIAKGRIYE